MFQSPFAVKRVLKHFYFKLLMLFCRSYLQKENEHFFNVKPTNISPMPKGNNYICYKPFCYGLYH